MALPNAGKTTLQPVASQYTYIYIYKKTRQDEIILLSPFNMDLKTKPNAKHWTACFNLVNSTAHKTGIARKPVKVSATK